MALFYASIFIALGRASAVPAGVARGQGARAQTIGVVLAMPMILRLFAIPLATRAADRHDALRAGHHGRRAGRACRASARSAFTAGTLAIAVVYALAATAFMLLFVLSDVYALRGLAPHRRAYGPVRLWGSAAFIVANLAAGYLLDIIAARDLIWLIVAAVALVRGRGLGAAAARRAGRGQPGRNAAGARAAARSRRSSRWRRRRA